MYDRLSTYSPQALAVLRIVAAVLVIEAGSVLLFNVPASVHPPPPPEMETLMLIAAILVCFVLFYLVFAGPGAWSVDNARRVRIAAGA